MVLFFFLRWLCEIGSILPSGGFVGHRFSSGTGKKKRPQAKFKNTPVRFPRAIQSPESWNMTGTQWEWHQQDGYSVLFLGV